MGRLKIGVGAATRRRLNGLQALLNSYADMDFPEGAEVIFLFCENDTQLGAQGVIDAFAEKTGFQAELKLQTEPGIPFARNMVLDMALEHGCDYLTFVDDDETVAKDWLVKLIECAETRQLDLVGGPVTSHPPSEPLSWGQRSMMVYLEDRFNKRHKHRREAALNGRDHELNIYTNNWCARLSSVSELKVRFNEDMAFTGGSDTRFSLDMKAAGARIGWASDAHVHEVIPSARLKPTYQYARARDQSANGVRMKNYGLLRALPSSLQRFLDGILNLLVAPFLGGKHLASAVYKFGAGVGRIKGAIGPESRHYAPGSESVHTE